MSSRTSGSRPKPHFFVPVGKAATAAGFLLICTVMLFGSLDGIDNTMLLFLAVVVGGYLALNIGANDAANNIGTAVGSGAITLGGALAVAVAGELAGAFLASDPVSTRLRANIFDPCVFGGGEVLAQVLAAGMLAGAFWLHLATVMKTPISATHSVIGGLLGAGVYAGGWGVAQWDQISSFALIWLATPLAAALVGGSVLYAIEHLVISGPNLIGQARARVPLLIALLSLLLANYFFVKVAPEDWAIREDHLIAGMAIAVSVFLIAQPWVHRMAQTIKNNRQGVSKLFVMPLILATAFFAFAHGANNAGNVAAPLAAIATIASDGMSPDEILLPTWTLAVSAFGIATGLLLYGSRIVHTVGSEITEIDKLRAFCIMFSAALVIGAASHFGFPVSTTHTVVGSIFGVGLFRELVQLNERRTLEKIRKCHDGKDIQALESFLQRFQGATLPKKHQMLDALYREHGEVRLTPKEIRRINKLYHRGLVKRSLFRRILGFWILTIPSAALLGALMISIIH